MCFVMNHSCLDVRCCIHSHSFIDSIDLLFSHVYAKDLNDNLTFADINCNLVNWIVFFPVCWVLAFGHSRTSVKIRRIKSTAKFIVISVCWGSLYMCFYFLNRYRRYNGSVHGFCTRAHKFSFDIGNTNKWLMCLPAVQIDD